MKTSLYVDGFNFYYGCFRQQQRRCVPADKWLNWRYLADRLAGRGHQVHKVHYFTAYIHRSEFDPEQNIRQQTYFRALDSVQSVELHFGKHIRVERVGRVLKPEVLGLPRGHLLRVSTYEEKGSDVNLAVHLLDNAWSADMERAIVISNDTDLIEAIRLAWKHIRVDVVSPYAKCAKQLRRAADFVSVLDPGLLRECRMSIPKIARDGTELYPPQSWTLEAWPDSEG